VSDFLQQQRKIYNRKWNEYSWNGEKLFPPLLSLEQVLSGSTASLHYRHKPSFYNVIGAPRSGTKWLQVVVSKIIELGRREFSLKNFIVDDGDCRVTHMHEGVVEDFERDQKILFIYRDIRDAIVSGYFYIKNGLHGGTMGCTTQNYKKLSKSKGIRNQMIMYMKYRMPAIYYWWQQDQSNLFKVKYENLLLNQEAVIREIADFLNFKLGEKELDEIIRTTSFKNMASGRERGVEHRKSHERKGVIGDWRNHFNADHKRLFREMGGEDYLKIVGYQV